MSTGIDHDRDRCAPPILPHTVIVDLLDMPEPVPGKPFLHTFQKRDLVGEECVLIFHRFTGKGKALLLRDRGVVFSMLLKTGDLAPVHFSRFIGLTVEHVRVDPADSKPAAVDPAPVVLKETARSLGIVLDLQRIAGDIERAVLVAELGIRRRFERIGIDLPDRGHIPVKQEDMAVECPGAAFRAGSAPKPDVPDHTGKAVYRIRKKGVFFLRESSDAVRYGDKGYDNHRYVRMGRAARDIVVM